MWTSGGVVDLNPSGFTGSSALATDGAQQVGNGAPHGGANHALLWMGSASSVIDLHPAGENESSAWGVGGGQQVGYGGNVGSRHALLWTGSAQSVVNLHPSGFYETVALAVAAGRQVGWGVTIESQFAAAHNTENGSPRALLWNGTANSVVDLHVFLPAGFTWSRANGIDAAGNIIGIAGDALRTNHAILWVRQ